GYASRTSSRSWAALTCPPAWRNARTITKRWGVTLWPARRRSSAVSSSQLIHPPVYQPVGGASGGPDLAGAAHVVGTIVDGLFDEELAVANFDVVATIRIGADPGLEVDRRALAAEIREGDEIPIVTLTTFW